MGRFSIIVAVLIALSAVPAAFADGERVRMRSDGNIINIDGQVIAIQNKDDRRNTATNKYYTVLDRNNKPSGKSDFYVIRDPYSGFVKKDINPVTPKVPEVIAMDKKQEKKPVEKKPETPVTPAKEPEKKEPAKTTIILDKDPNKAIYDNLKSPGGSVYE